MHRSILRWTKALGCAVVALISIVSVSDAMAATLSVSGGALNNFAGDEQVTLVVTCTINGSGTPCAGDELVVSTDVVRFGFSQGFGAAGSDFSTGQIKAYAASGGATQFSGAFARGYMTEQVALDLAAGSSWPQSFTVRLILDGTFSKPFSGGGGGTYYSGRFRDIQQVGLDVPFTFFGSALGFPAIHEQVITISAPTDFFVEADLRLNAISERNVTIDFSTRTLNGLRFEVDLPLGLVMTSESGVFLTEDPQDEPVILPPPPLPGVPNFRMPVPGFQLPRARRYDPPVVIGYEYEAIGGTFATVELPTDIGDGIYDIEVYDDLAGEFVFLQSLLGGEPLILELDAVDRFRVLGIEAEAGLDPADTEAFVTTLAFTGPVTELVMTPIEGSSVPLMSSWAIALLASLLVSLGVWRGSRRLASD